MRRVAAVLLAAQRRGVPDVGVVLRRGAPHGAATRPGPARFHRLSLPLRARHPAPTFGPSLPLLACSPLYQCFLTGRRGTVRPTGSCSPCTSGDAPHARLITHLITNQEGRVRAAQRHALRSPLPRHACCPTPVPGCPPSTPALPHRAGTAPPSAAHRVLEEHDLPVVRGHQHVLQRWQRWSSALMWTDRSRVPLPWPQPHTTRLQSSMQLLTTRCTRCTMPEHPKKTPARMSALATPFAPTPCAPSPLLHLHAVQVNVEHEWRGVRGGAVEGRPPHGLRAIVRLQHLHAGRRPRHTCAPPRREAPPPPAA